MDIQFFDYLDLFSQNAPDARSNYLFVSGLHSFADASPTVGLHSTPVDKEYFLIEGGAERGPHLGKTDLVSVAQPLPQILGFFLSKQDKNFLFLKMKYLTGEIGVYGPKMVLHIPNS